MLFRPEKISLREKLKEQSFPGVFLVLTVLAMAGWVYFLGSIAWKFLLWCFA